MISSAFIKDITTKLKEFCEREGVRMPNKGAVTGFLNGFQSNNPKINDSNFYSYERREDVLKAFDDLVGPESTIKRNIARYLTRIMDNSPPDEHEEKYRLAMQDRRMSVIKRKNPTTDQDIINIKRQWAEAATALLMQELIPDDCPEPIELEFYLQDLINGRITKSKPKTVHGAVYILENERLNNRGVLQGAMADALIRTSHLDYFKKRPLTQTPQSPSAPAQG